VELGADVVADEASATYDDGILRVEIPIADPSDEKRQVPIRGRERNEDT
jgi:HSP20 family protein